MSFSPKTVDAGGVSVALSLFGPDDLFAVRSFARDLPEHDLLFLNRDIKHAKVIEAWLVAIDEGSITSLIARNGDKVVATTAIVRDTLGWSPHVAEIRLLIGAEMRGRGLGRILLNECVTLALDAGATKLISRMTPDQRAAVALFEDAGFRGEAMLRDHVRDRAGTVHDLAVLSLDVAKTEGRRDAYGFAGDAAS